MTLPTPLRRLLPAILLLLAAAGAIRLLAPDDHRPAIEPASAPAPMPAAAKRPSTPPPSTAEERAASEGDTAIAPETAESPLPQAPFSLEQIAAALSRLDIDDNGELQLNADAREILEAAFVRPERPLSVEQLSELRALIRAGLPGSAGQRAATVAERYYHYSNALRDVRGNFEYLGNLPDLEQGFSQLSQLRRDHLGKELAADLFDREEKLQRYTLESMRIQSARNLSAKEKRALQAALREKYFPEEAAAAPAAERP
ncbi:lipase secretion chaperone [Microbulbifer halophilus]|uniref:Lipase chaperone n=1 Tax=Microbulbifer halophilus TaxID=453963 RepID=A0ABW5ED98_9GAMM|nr:lipase secretion chaperone [Microbulbifer halophilus]MCW8127303.1 lipase secretion chaperone [Microbulbifer halophilus]